jgi:ribosomal protein S18 acetylase RimI-like enzyme
VRTSEAFGVPVLYVRDTQPSDVPALAAVMYEVIEQTQAYLEPRAPNGYTLQAYVLAAHAGERIHLVAQFGLEILGWVEVVPYPQQTMRHAANLAMGVSARFRGRGIGTALLIRGIERAFASGFRIIHLEVDATNQGALRLYRKHGFTVDGVRRMAKRCPQTGRYQDIVLMSYMR